MDGKIYVKLLVGFYNTSAVILQIVILCFRSKNSNQLSPPTFTVNLIFPVSSMFLRQESTKKDKQNKERESDPCVQTENMSSQYLLHVMKLRAKLLQGPKASTAQRSLKRNYWSFVST